LNGGALLSSADEPIDYRGEAATIAWRYDANGSITAFLNEVFDRMKPGSAFVYVDNGGGNFSAKIDAIVAARNDLKTLVSDERPEGRLPTDERRDVIEGPFKARFKDAWVKMKGNVGTRVWLKQ